MSGGLDLRMHVDLLAGLGCFVVSPECVFTGILRSLDGSMGSFDSVVVLGLVSNVHHMLGGHDSSVGCGNGSFLGSMSEFLDGSLSGSTCSESSSLFGSFGGHGGVGSDFIHSLGHMGRGV